MLREHWSCQPRQGSCMVLPLVLLHLRTCFTSLKDTDARLFQPERATSAPDPESDAMDHLMRRFVLLCGQSAARQLAAGRPGDRLCRGIAVSAVRPRPNAQPAAIDRDLPGTVLQHHD